MMQERSTFASVWSAFLVFGSTAASLIFACATPFAALAAVAALTLPPRLALITTMGVWLGNQAVGFLMLGYPLTASALAWGPILGGAAIVATAVAIQVSAQFDRADLRHWLAVFAAALASGEHQALLRRQPDRRDRLAHGRGRRQCLERGLGSRARGRPSAGGRYDCPRGAGRRTLSL
jgi:hypothetical protein